jgi:protection-of-telomeres protein 1
LRNGVPSILTNFSTEIHVLPASRIPSAAPSGPSGSLWQSFPPSKSQPPTAAETAHVIWANAQTPEMGLPSTQEFQEKSLQSVRVKDKFCLLMDVKSDGFYDILGQVIKVLDSPVEPVTMYLSDYTENTNFYHHTWGREEFSGGQDGDEYGYTISRPKQASWPGPYGKMSIQLTLYDGHAAFVRQQVEVDNWVLLRNVQIKFGKVGEYLEGYLRGDRSSFEGKVQIQIMKQSLDSDENDSRWKAALRRKWCYEKKFELQKQHILDEAAGKKRKRDEQLPKNNSKTRRKERRAMAEEKAAAADVRVMKKLDLNENSKSEGMLVKLMLTMSSTVQQSQ